MFAKVKSTVFIDVLRFQLDAPKGECLRGILRDEKGCICRILEKSMVRDVEEWNWEGLNDLPYGRYTLELSQGQQAIEMKLVKRV